MRNNGESYFRDTINFGCGVFIGAFIYGLFSHGFSLLYIIAALILGLAGSLIAYPIKSYYLKRAEKSNQ
jgi:hypothetical protein